MGGYFDRGASTGGNDEGYFNREDVTGDAGVGSAFGGPADVAHENLQVDPDNPNIVRAIPTLRQQATDETAGNTSPSTRADEDVAGLGIIEGSDSERTGTSWGLPGREDASGVEVGRASVEEGEDEGEVHPNRNTANRLTKDDLKDVGSWSTIDKTDSAGSPTGFS